MTNGTYTIETAKDESCGFLTAAQVRAIAEDPTTRLEMLLIRWNEGRALVPAQNVADLIAAAGLGGWSVRDVSVPAGR